MKKELTSEEIAKVFEMYRGCDYTFMDIRHVYKVGQCYTSTLAREKSWADCKLLLTPLSKITDEHAIEVGYIIFSNEKGSVREKDMIAWVAYNMKTKERADNLSFRACQYLILKGYAVPLFFGLDHWANGKTAIELNLAIDTTTLNNHESK